MVTWSGFFFFFQMNKFYVKTFFYINQCINYRSTVGNFRYLISENDRITWVERGHYRPSSSTPLPWAGNIFSFCLWHFPTSLACCEFCENCEKSGLSVCWKMSHLCWEGLGIRPEKSDLFLLSGSTGPAALPRSCSWDGSNGSVTLYWWSCSCFWVQA